MGFYSQPRRTSTFARPYQLLVSAILLLASSLAACSCGFGQEIVSQDILIFDSADVSIDGSIMAFESPATDIQLSNDNGNRGGELMRLLQDERIRNEIELVDEQYGKMKAHNERQSEGMRELTSKLLSSGKNGKSLSLDHDVLKQLKKRLENQQTQSKKELEEMLLPHQIHRLKQVARQISMSRAGTAKVLTEQLGKELDLTEKQSKQLLEKSQEIEAQLEKDIAKLRAQAKEDLFSVLTHGQREKLKDMIGEHFERPERRRSSIREMSIQRAKEMRSLNSKAPN